MNNETNGQLLVCASSNTNFENKSLCDLKEMRKLFNMSSVDIYDEGIAYLVRMTDVLLEKVERLENNNECIHKK